jgi:hypothetical protein
MPSTAPVAAVAAAVAATAAAAVPSALVQAVIGGAAKGSRLASNGSGSASSNGVVGAISTPTTSSSSMAGSTNNSLPAESVQACVDSTTVSGTTGTADADTTAADTAAAAAAAASLDSQRAAWDLKLRCAVRPTVASGEMLDAEGITVLTNWVRNRPATTLKEIHSKWHILRDCWEAKLLDETLYRSLDKELVEVHEARLA